MYDDDYTGAKISGMIRISSGSESNLLGAVAYVGPVAVAIDGNSNAFRVSQLKISHMLFSEIYDSNMYTQSLS